MPYRKKILIFSTAYLPMIGGAEIAVKEITDRIDDCEFNLICARIDKKLPAREKIGKVNVYRVGWGRKIDKIFLPILGTLKAMALEKPDAIWALMASHGGFTALFFKLLNPKIPFLLTLQEGDSLDYIKSKMKPFFLWRMIFTRADYIQAISNYLADWGRAMGARCSISVVPNGANPTNYEFNRITNKELREKLNIRDSEKVIITTSRLVLKNKIDDLISAMQFLKNKPYKLLILGDGPLRDNSQLTINNLHLEENIILLGTVAPEKVPEYLAIADVFVRPSLSEGLGNSFLEAMAAGVPIIGTPVGGITDFLINNETGLFCEVENPRSIAEKIEALLSDETLRQKLISNGRKLIEEKYNWNIIAKKINNILTFLRM